MGPGGDRGGPRARNPDRPRAGVRRDGAAPVAPRAGRLHPRPQRVPIDRARGRSSGAGAAAGDRAAGRAGARAGARDGPRCRDRFRRGRAGDRRRAARLRGDRDRHLGRGAGGRARQRRCARPRLPGQVSPGHDPGGRRVRPGRRQSPLRRRARVGGASTGGRRVGAARGAARRPRRPRRDPRPPHPPHAETERSSSRYAGHKCVRCARARRSGPVRRTPSPAFLPKPGFGGIQRRTDLAGIDRVVWGAREP